MRLQHSKALGRAIRVGESPDELGRSTLRAVTDAIDAGDPDGARTMLEYARVEFQSMLDSTVEWVWALLTWIQREVSEAAVEDAMRATLGPYVAERYGGLLDLTFDERTALTVEAMRGLLSGPDRMGDVRVTRHDDRVTLEFEPCGSGGAARRGDPNRGVPPADMRPELSVAAEAHDWTWGEEGVCLYCSHCSVVNELLPIETLGFPLRVTEHPRAAGDPCRWTLYEDPAAVPAWVYERVGRTKPTAHELQELWQQVRETGGQS